MIFFVIASLSIGIEGGVNLPAVGFDNLNSGTVFRVFAGKPMGFVSSNFGIETSFNSGDNPGYGICTYGLRLAFFRTNWRLAPIFELGIDYLSRSMNNTSEAGVVFDYALGFLLAFRAQSVQIIPKLYYRGITDYEKHAGFIGMKLGIVHDL